MPAELRVPFKGKLDDVVAELKRLDSRFTGIDFEDMPKAVHGRYDPANHRIVLNSRYKNRPIPRGLLAEEVRHFLDDVQYGMNSTDVVKRAWFTDQKLAIPADLNNLSPATIHKIDMWHHRRVFGRLFKDLDQGDTTIRMILDPGDIGGVYEAYQGNAFGRLSPAELIDLIDQGWFPGGF